jgi:transposase, IS5 family
MVGQPGFFDVDERLRRLSDLGDQLEAYGRVVDFEIFRPELETALSYSDGAKGGRPPCDPVMMFKILLIQAQNNLSDERTEFLINDRLSFMRFLGLALGDRVPDATTIWLFREKLTKAGVIQALFSRFDAAVRAAGYIPMSGQIVDASLVAAPRQRNTEDEKADLKAGRIPQAWQEKPARLRQKDRDARWTVKFTKAKPREDATKQVDIAVPAFGYQSHISIDRRHGLIRRWAVTDAAAYGGRLLRQGLLDKTNTASEVWPTPPTARRPTRPIWPRTVSRAASTARS